MKHWNQRGLASSPWLLFSLFALASLSAACGADRQGPSPKIERVEPNVIHTANQDATVTLIGTGFSPAIEGALDDPRVMMPKIELIGQDGTVYHIDQANVSFPADDISGTRLVVTVPAQLVPPRALGEPDAIYDLKVINPDGSSHTLTAAITVRAPSFFAITSIDPPFACTCADQLVTIVSDGAFVSTPVVGVRPADQSDLNDLSFLQRVAFVDANTLTAVVPAGLPLGTYDLVVINPESDGRIGLLEDSLRIVRFPIPRIVHILPGRGTTQVNTGLTIFGRDFRGPARVELLNPSMTVVESLTPARVTAEQIDVQVPTTRMSVGPYLVRVVNEDEETYYSYASFLVTNPAGNLNTFEQDSPTVIGRRMVAGTSVADDLGNRYIVAIGGDTGQNGEVLDTIERAQLSKFGALSAWQVQRNTLTVPRRGASAVALPLFNPAYSPYIPEKTYVYVVGGRDASGNVLNTVERAVVLSSTEAPTLQAEPAASAGSLAAGTWYYKVSAVLAADDADNPGGETLPSDEAIIRTGANGAVTLSWAPVTVRGSAAVAYRIYRSPEVDGRSQDERFLAEVTTTSYTDDGSQSTTDAAPHFPGATGVFHEINRRMTMPRWGHHALLVQGDDGNRHLAAVAGSAGQVVLDTIEFAAFDVDGNLGGFNPSAEVLAVGRVFPAAVVQTKANVATYDQNGSRLWLAGGYTSTAATDTIEWADFGTSLGAWETLGKKVLARGGSMAVITNQKAFFLGGAGGTPEAPTAVRTDGRDSQFDGVGMLSGAVNSTASSLLSPRAFGVAITGAGFIYFVGGTSNGVDAANAVERTF